jgi:hypothetical protein
LLISLSYLRTGNREQGTGNREQGTGNIYLFIREMPKTLEDVADLVSYICALDKG